MCEVKFLIIYNIYLGEVKQPFLPFIAAYVNIKAKFDEEICFKTNALLYMIAI